ncbi:MAG: response regulator [Proteobacteria bacterium]|nr:response regulator [Pseudomonadota bacterium]MBU4472131.1 response regulator [Pseudomonadota bacterium]MCG2752870.1 response regulator [Desulfobacteraceae bacterium]
MEIKKMDASGNPFELAKFDLQVLLVEDQWAEQRLISKRLKSMGCQVTVAQNLQEAGHLLKNAPMDMVLMDSGIYSQNGFDFSSVVEEAERKTGKSIPVIGLAGNFIKTQRDQYMANGMDEYLPKPVSENELFRVMVKLAGNVKYLNPELSRMSAG